MRSRKFFGTVWKLSDICYLKTLKYKYLLISALDHTEEGQEHYHCFIQFNSNRLMPRTENTHWEIPKDISGCLKYIHAKGEPEFEDGEIGLNCREKADWSMFVEACKRQTPKELIDGPYSQLYATYRGFAGEVHNQYKTLERIDGELDNYWFYGDPGTGKTKEAWDKYPDLYVKSINKWWDGYSDQDVVLLDDWDPKHDVLVSHLKIWADRYPFRAETKGSSLMIRPKMIIVTSNYSIDQCFQNEEDVKAIKRRFKVVHFSTLNTRPPM